MLEATNHVSNRMGKSNFSGTWIFNPTKSVLQIPYPESTVFVIDHREPVFRFSRTLVIRGASDTLELNLTTDGNQTVGERGELHFRSRLFWDGEALVFESNVETKGESGVNVVRYTLSPTGDSLVAEERFRSRSLNYDNKWVLEKQP